MSIVRFSKFKQYRDLLYALPSSYTVDMIRNEEFLLDRDEKKKLEIYYAPFEYVNERAKVVIVGITPGLHQMKKSFSTVIETKDQLNSEEDILHEVKKRSSFEGPMRKNLVKMLDELGLHEYLGLSSTIELFDEANSLVHTGSVLNYPVFYQGKNYSGTTPDILKTELLRKHIMEGFATEISNMDQPLIIPLGVNVSKVLTYLAKEKYLDSGNLLLGFPHPSGGNGHRHRQFAENKEQMQEMIRDYFLQHPMDK
ncbi:uracil-DNA glycosylase family protein [Peribacillus sp. NPDC097675]|uniref:uracil-DNA glycosylase family protein n=1 Tax=Peribacillus sp. NPDC097675 TaxID=3390618 RepID=UPI003D093AAB